MHKKPLYLFITLLIWQCGSPYIIKKPAEGVKLSKVIAEQLMFSSSEIRLVDGNKRLVYKKWFFMKADKEGLHFRYEESFDANKTTADLVETRFFALKDDTIRLPGYTVYIYELKEDFVAYTLEPDIK